MKLLAFLFFLALPVCVISQVKIHAHNDYEKPTPLFNALNSQVFSVEADVFLVDGKLRVAHSADQLDRAKTLNELYIDPIVALFKKNKGYISADTGYKVALMIDIKTGGEEAIREVAR